MNTKLLKQKILDLAIRGKLTQQLKTDGTAKDLLTQISDERRKTRDERKGTGFACHSGAKRSGAIESKKSKDPVQITPLNKSEAPFEIPSNWEWVRLGDLMSKVGAGSTPTGGKNIYETSGVKFIRSQNVYNDGLRLDDVVYINESIHQQKQNSRVVGNDLLLNITGASIGRCAIVPNDFDEANVNQHVLILRLLNFDLLKYIHFAITSQFVFRQIMGAQVGGTKEGLSAERAKELQIPLPPLAEQQRIVAKIEEAFAEIDAIEKNKELLKTHIKQTRQKILDLAIHGKLVPQNKADGTAHELLSVILSEAQGAKSKDLKKINVTRDNPHYEKIENEPFEIPESWAWVRINDIASDMADGPFGSNLKAEHYTDKKEARIIQLSNIAENGWKDENVRYTTFEHAKKNISRSIVEAGNLVIAKMMPAGRAMICPSTEKMYVLSSDAVKLVPIDEINNQFLCYAINSPYFKAQVNGNIQGTTRLRTSISKLRECLLALPPLNEQSRIVAKIEELFSTLDQMERNLV